ncbi:MAG: transporter related protein [Acidimicrobiales bacterium]|nr:transporter related protein [Acidimicrobiales bacterium]
MTAAIEADDLYRFFHAGDDETLALRGVSLAVELGEVVAVMGPSGAGKSTLLACLAGLDDPDGGSVVVAGERLSRRTESDRAGIRARHIGMVFQSDNLLSHLSVRDNLRLVQQLVPRSSRADIGPLLASLGIEHRRRAHPGELSGGELGRAGLAVALANDPEVLLADEPTGELDAMTEREVLSLLRERAEAGTAVVVVTHSPIVANAADRVVTLHDGVEVQS